MEMVAFPIFGYLETPTGTSDKPTHTQYDIAFARFPSVVGTNTELDQSNQGLKPTVQQD